MDGDAATYAYCVAAICLDAIAPQDKATRLLMKQSQLIAACLRKIMQRFTLAFNLETAVGRVRVCVFRLAGKGGAGVSCGMPHARVTVWT